MSRGFVHVAGMPELGKAAVALCLLRDFFVEKFTPRGRHLSLNTKGEDPNAHLHSDSRLNSQVFSCEHTRAEWEPHHDLASDRGGCPRQVPALHSPGISAKLEPPRTPTLHLFTVTSARAGSLQRYHEPQF